jgi:hypothetical protein
MLYICVLHLNDDCLWYDDAISYSLLLLLFMQCKYDSFFDDRLLLIISEYNILYNSFKCILLSFIGWCVIVEWAQETVENAEVIRILYRGRFLEDDVTMDSTLSFLTPPLSPA